MGKLRSKNTSMKNLRLVTLFILELHKQFYHKPNDIKMHKPH